MSPPRTDVSEPAIRSTPARLGALALGCALALACSKSSPETAAQALPDGGSVEPGGEPDGGTPAAGGTDAGTPGTGAPDGGTGPVTPVLKFGTPGPWPVANRTFGAADGIQDPPVVGVSTDEAQNLWVATATSLYLMRPGDARFTRYTAADGLHLMGNPVTYTESYCGAQVTVSASARPPGIASLVGGGEGEVFVGYWGATEGNGGCPDGTGPDAEAQGNTAQARHDGKLDRVRLQPDGTLDVTRFDLVSVGYGMLYWHNRTVLRMVYDHGQIYGHDTHPHTLYVGANHGVDLILPDAYRPPAPGEWIDLSQYDWMGDHLHVAPCNHAPCGPSNAEDLRTGWWLGLAIAPDGGLWTAGLFSAGKIKWDALGPYHWQHERAGHDAFEWAFGDPMPGNPPVFDIASYGLQEGDYVDMSAVAVTPDDTAWFATKAQFGKIDFGVASFAPGHGFTYYAASELGLDDPGVQDMVALPDGRLVLASAGAGLAFYDPATRQSVKVRASSGLIPDDQVQRLEVDTMVDPPALHVATASGAAVIRVFPR
jgi:hypothetical protein